VTTLLIADAGPLFSLASAASLGILLNFNLAVTDVVKSETFDRGLLPGCSKEPAELLKFYTLNSAKIAVRETSVGLNIAQQTIANPLFLPPKNSGELSILSLLPELLKNKEDAIILFEDHWFIHNRTLLDSSFGTLSTRAFLTLAEQAQLISSADAILQDMQTARRIPSQAVVNSRNDSFIPKPKNT
jgi:hypothetical protein